MKVGQATNLSKYNKKQRKQSKSRNGVMAQIRQLNAMQDKQWTNARHQKILKLQKKLRKG